MTNQKKYKKTSTSNVKVVSLEYLLQKYFGLKSQLFLSKPKIIEYCDNTPIYENMTVAGNKAYTKMINFIMDLSNLGVNGIDEGTLIDELDEITNEI